MIRKSTTDYTNSFGHGVTLVTTHRYIEYKGDITCQKYFFIIKVLNTNKQSEAINLQTKQIYICSVSYSDVELMILMSSNSDVIYTSLSVTCQNKKGLLYLLLK